MPATIAIGHVGDSRAYRLRDGAFEQLTPDHSLVGELVRSGRLSTEEAEHHPHRSVITRAVGTEPTVDVETLTVAAEPGDLYLICSDGLTDIVRDEQIAELDQCGRPRPRRSGRGARRRGEPRRRDRQHHRRPVRDRRGRPRAAFSCRAEPVALEPDEDTMEQATAPVAVAEAPTEPEAVPVRRHGAGAGGRWLALLAIILALAVAAMVLWWSLGR